MDNYNFIFGNVDFPCQDIHEIKRDVVSGYADICCRIYLKAAPDAESEAIAREYDGADYSHTCFFLETNAYKDGPGEDWQTSDWFLFYVKNDGNWIDIYDGLVIPEAWDLIRDEYNKL